jgi:hypothetical protein
MYQSGLRSCTSNFPLIGWAEIREPHPPPVVPCPCSAHRPYLTDWTLDYTVTVEGDNSLTERDIATFTFEIRAKRLQQKNAPADSATAMHEASIDGTSVTINLPALTLTATALSRCHRSWWAWLLFAINL